MIKLTWLLIIIIITAFAYKAYAYDDVESTHKLVNCMIRAENKFDFDEMGLIVQCRPQVEDFIRYNCPYNIESCQGVPTIIACKVIDHKKGISRGC